MRPVLAPLAPLSLLIVLTCAAPAAAQQNGCIGETDAAAVEIKPGAPPLRFGITPGAQTGQFVTGAVEPRLPEDPAKHLAALEALRGSPARPFVLRLHRFFWSDGEPGIQKFKALVDRYTAAGFPVELQLRYHPSPEQEGDMPAWVAFVERVVTEFGVNPGVVAIQVTNEVNITFSPDSSDGAYEGAREALVQGVIAAKRRAREIHSGVEIGFNWAYRMDPVSDTSFWNALRDRGGPEFVASLDWVGVDAYPGTLFPPAHTPGGERDGVVNALSSARCFMSIPGIPERVPLHIEENGWPTSPMRSEAQQVTAMDTMVRAFHDFRGTYNVTDYRWFNLRDGDSTNANFQTRYGLLRDDYSEKPAFAHYAGLVNELAPVVAPVAVRSPSRHGDQWRVRMRCGRVRVSGAGVRSVRAGRRVDRRRPFSLRVPRSTRRVSLVITLRSGERVRVVRRAARCKRR